MSEQFTRHTTFVLERVYDASPARVFNAWADPAAKGAWFAGPDEWVTIERAFDFRVGGSERAYSGPPGGTVHKFDCRYYDIVPDERIVYCYDLHLDARRISVSLTTVEFKPEELGDAIDLHRASRVSGRLRRRRPARARIARAVGQAGRGAGTRRRRLNVAAAGGPRRATRFSRACLRRSRHGRRRRHGRSRHAERRCLETLHPARRGTRSADVRRRRGSPPTRGGPNRHDPIDGRTDSRSSRGRRSHHSRTIRHNPGRHNTPLHNLPVQPGKPHIRSASPTRQLPPNGAGTRFCWVSCPCDLSFASKRSSS